MNLSDMDNADRAIVREAIASAWALAQIVTHTPQPKDKYGYTCDERGCDICNGSLDTLPERTAALASDRSDFEEAADALENLVDWLRGQ